MSAERWDVRLTPTGSGERTCLKINLPVALSQPMKERGFNRAEIEVVENGLLIRPYQGDGKNQSLRIIDLPESWGTP